MSALLSVWLRSHHAVRAIAESETTKKRRGKPSRSARPAAIGMAVSKVNSRQPCPRALHTARITGVGVRKSVSRPSRRCVGAGAASAQADAVGAARLGAIGGRREEIAAPWTLPLHHAGHRLPRPGVDRTCLRFCFIRRRLSGHAFPLGRLQSSSRRTSQWRITLEAEKLAVRRPLRWPCCLAGASVACADLADHSTKQREATPLPAAWLFMTFISPHRPLRGDGE